MISRCVQEKTASSARVETGELIILSVYPVKGLRDHYVFDKLSYDILFELHQ